MTQEEGYIKLFRQIRQNWIWQDPDKLRAWLDLLLSAAFIDHKEEVDGTILSILRGTFLTSERRLAKRWNWSRDKVKNFLRCLTNEGMISTKKATKAATALTLITISNFDFFQGVKPPCNPPSSRHRAAIEPPQEKNDKNTKNDKSIYTRTRAKNRFKNFAERDDDINALMYQELTQ